MAMSDDTDLDRPRLPTAVYLIVGVLAIIGLISIIGFVMGTVGSLIKLALLAGLAVLVIWGLKALLIGKPRPD